MTESLSGPAPRRTRPAGTVLPGARAALVRKPPEAVMRPRPLVAIGLAALVAIASGCASARRSPVTPSDIAQVGQASWYGIEERGRLTANGETMDPTQLTAAHRELPFGTLVAVTDLDTGRRVEVRINDRGPFISGRIIDLSHEAARRLGIIERGLARVALRVIGHIPGEPFTVQVAAFRGRSAAERFSRELRGHGYSGVEIARTNGMHRVRIGRFRRRTDAANTARSLERLGYEALIVRVRL